MHVGDEQSLENTDSDDQPWPGLLLFPEENALGRAGSSEKLAVHQHPAVPFRPPAPIGPPSTERLVRSRRVLNSQGSNRACVTCTDSTFRWHPGQGDASELGLHWHSSWWHVEEKAKKRGPLTLEIVGQLGLCNTRRDMVAERQLWYLCEGTASCFKTMTGSLSSSSTSPTWG